MKSKFSSAKQKWQLKRMRDMADLAITRVLALNLNKRYNSESRNRNQFRRLNNLTTLVQLKKKSLAKLILLFRSTSEVKLAQRNSRNKSKRFLYRQVNYSLLLVLLIIISLTLHRLWNVNVFSLVKRKPRNAQVTKVLVNLVALRNDNLTILSLMKISSFKVDLQLWIDSSPNFQQLNINLRFSKIVNTNQEVGVGITLKMKDKCKSK